MKETYVLVMFQNGDIRPCIIRRNLSPLLGIGDKVITDKGNGVCITPECGRYCGEDPVGEIAHVMQFNRDLLPVVRGQIHETMWETESERRQEYEE